MKTTTIRVYDKNLPLIKKIINQRSILAKLNLGLEFRPSVADVCLVMAHEECLRLQKLIDDKKKSLT